MHISSQEVMPIIRSALERSQRVCLTVTGSSMLPFMWNNAVVEVEPVFDIRIGDVVLIQANQSMGKDRYVLHRIVRIENGNEFFIRGDSQSYIEGPFNRDSILGRVASVRNNKYKYKADHVFWRHAGIIWIYLFPFNLLLLRLIKVVIRLWKRIIRNNKN